VLEIEDDGIGFDAADVAAQTGHYGLLGLGERARLVGGKLDLLSKPGQGTLLRFHIPKESQEKTHA
jgi:signal transduction histidine kinase